jgi:hypothetical protein
MYRYRLISHAFTFFTSSFCLRQFSRRTRKLGHFATLHVTMSFIQSCPNHIASLCLHLRELKKVRPSLVVFSGSSADCRRTCRRHRRPQILFCQITPTLSKISSFQNSRFWTCGQHHSTDRRHTWNQRVVFRQTVLKWSLGVNVDYRPRLA